ncbi:MarR family winged helix-turn-helix transcriptional regulator [Halonatronum saccharophilum]|uniref:MarR family winged helix-turn-helix transcriptional regulator n=1 Tax=Halonatronum saccharophilum TaxID=150060 RepID=UPI0004ACC9D9|nr:MarR family transcriptional regulator [Halonatronum saccharophilum]
MNIEEKVKRLECVLFEIMLESYKRLSSETRTFNIREHLLIEIIGRKGIVTMSELAEIISCPPTTMTSIVNGLVKRGYFERERSKEDRRVVLVSLSIKGKEYYNKHMEESEKILKDMFSNVNEKKLDYTIELFLKIRERLNDRFSID